MSTYVPKYLEFNNRQIDGWPKGLSEETKQWATDRIKALFEKYTTVNLEFARINIFDRNVVSPPEELREAKLYDYQYAVADRALRAAHAEQTWVLERSWERRRFRVFVGGKVSSPLSPHKKLVNFIKKNDPNVEFGGLAAWTEQAVVGDIFTTLNNELTVVCVDISNSLRSEGS